MDLGLIHDIDSEGKGFLRRGLAVRLQSRAAAVDASETT